MTTVKKKELMNKAYDAALVTAGVVGYQWHPRRSWVKR